MFGIRLIEGVFPKLFAAAHHAHFQIIFNQTRVRNGLGLSLNISKVSDSFLLHIFLLFIHLKMGLTLSIVGISEISPNALKRETNYQFLSNATSNDQLLVAKSPKHPQLRCHPRCETLCGFAVAVERCPCSRCCDCCCYSQQLGSAACGGRHFHRGQCSHSML